MNDMQDILVEELPLPSNYPVEFLDDQAPEEMGRIRIRVTDGNPDIICTARRIGCATTQKRGSKFWTELEVYQTERHRFVGVEMGLGLGEACEARCRAGVVRRLSELPEIFEYRPLSMKLYRSLGIETIEVP